MSFQLPSHILPTTGKPCGRKRLTGLLWISAAGQNRPDKYLFVMNVPDFFSLVVYIPIINDSLESAAEGPAIAFHKVNKPINNKVRVGVPGNFNASADFKQFAHFVFSFAVCKPGGRPRRFSYYRNINVNEPYMQSRAVMTIPTMIFFLYL